MSDDEIEGRNLITDGSFSTDWAKSWTHDGVGNAVQFADPETTYLMMNAWAVVTQKVPLPRWTADQMSGVNHLFEFDYENLGEGGNSKVVLQTSGGKTQTLNLSGKPDAKQLYAEWRPFPEISIDNVDAATTDLTVVLHGSDHPPTSSSGLRITKIEHRVRLAALEVKSLQLDGREYVPA